VVRALGYLQQAGWIESRQGRGRFVRSKPAIAARQTPEHAAALLEREETARVKMLKVGPVLAPPRAANALGLDEGTPVIARQRLVIADEVGPIELGWTYVPVELASGTDVGDSAPLGEGLLEHLTRRKGVQFGHAVERLSGRLPTTDEARLLEVGRRDVLITLLVTVFDLAGAPRVAVDAVIPTARHELEDAFPII
jgi:GntR family transcriptional regulator